MKSVVNKVKEFAEHFFFDKPLDNTNRGIIFVNDTNVRETVLELAKERGIHVVFAHAPITPVGLPSDQLVAVSGGYETTVNMKTLFVENYDEDDTVHDICKKVLDATIANDRLFGIGTLFLYRVENTVKNGVHGYNIRFQTTLERHLTTEERDAEIAKSKNAESERLREMAHKRHLDNTFILANMDEKDVAEITRYGEECHMDIVPCSVTFSDDDGVSHTVIDSQFEFNHYGDIVESYKEAIDRIARHLPDTKTVYIHSVIRSESSNLHYTIRMYSV